MKIETQSLRRKIENDIVKLDELKARLEARLEAIQLVERTANEMNPETFEGLEGLSADTAALAS